MDAWYEYDSLKDGFDKLANPNGYLDVTDEKAMGVLAGSFNLDLDVVTRELKMMDIDSNGMVSFADFALWADRHTAGLPLGLESVPDKLEWRKGIPAHWSSIPPEEPAAPGALGGAEDDSELDAFILAAKRRRWDDVWDILGRHPTYVNRRPRHRGYNAIHFAAQLGDQEVLFRLLETFGADPRVLSKGGKTARDVAADKGNEEAKNLIDIFAAEYANAKPARRSSKSSFSPPARGKDMRALIDHANSIIDKAKWSRWEDMFALLEQHPEAVNVRPEQRRWAVIHQAAYKAEVAVLRRLVEDCKADVRLLSRDDRTALQVAQFNGNSDAVEYLGSLSLPGGAAGAGKEEAQAHAVIDAAKDGDWERTFRLLGEGPPGLVNMRPKVRMYSVLHQAAYHGDIEILRRLIEEFKANVKHLTQDKKNALDVAREQEHHMAAKYLEACVPNIKLDDEFVTYPDQRFVTLGEGELQTFRDLLLKTHKKDHNWTRDRRLSSGEEVKNTPVPTGYQLVGVRRNENPALWRTYQISREIMRMNCKARPVEPWKPLTAEVLDWSHLGLCAEANEWVLLHAGMPEALSAIARNGFSMTKLGSGGTSGGGGLYGSGTYFAESITKADEYARKKVEEEGPFKGCRAVAVVRVLGGRHFYTADHVDEAEKPNFVKRTLQGDYHSTVGDRLKLRNTYREYVTYDSAFTYLDSIVYYRREGVPEEHK